MAKIRIVEILRLRLTTSANIATMHTVEDSEEDSVDEDEGIRAPKRLVVLVERHENTFSSVFGSEKWVILK